MGRWMVVAVILTVLQFGNVAVAKAEPLSSASPETTDNIASTVKALRQFKITNENADIPLPAKPLLTTLKHQLRDLISQTLNAHGAEQGHMEKVRKTLSAELKRQGVVNEEEIVIISGGDNINREYTYGDVSEIAIRKIYDHPELLAATTTLGVLCGSDTSFYLFRKREQQWDLILAQEANDYEDISGAQGSFRYSISPSDDSGQFFVVASNINPWCSSNWQGIRYQVMRLGATPYQPKVLFKREDTIYLGQGHYGYIFTRSNRFTIEFDAGQRMDTGILVRRHTGTYEVNKDQVRRVTPFANDPESFLDEWFDLPWEEASKWVKPRVSGRLHKWHTRVREDRVGKDSRFFTEFLYSPPACRIKTGLWQVGVGFSAHADGTPFPKGMPKELYFTISEKNGAFYLTGISRKSLPICRHEKIDDP